MYSDLGDWATAREERDRYESARAANDRFGEEDMDEWLEHAVDFETDYASGDLTITVERTDES